MKRKRNKRSKKATKSKDVSVNEAFSILANSPEMKKLAEDLRDDPIIQEVNRRFMERIRLNNDL